MCVYVYVCICVCVCVRVCMCLTYQLVISYYMHINNNKIINIYKIYVVILICSYNLLSNIIRGIRCILFNINIYLL